MVGASVIIIRYRPQAVMVPASIHCELSTISENKIAQNLLDDEAGQFKRKFRWLISHTRMGPGQLVTRCVLSFTGFSFVLCGFAKIFFSEIIEGHWWAVLVVIITLFAMVLSFGIILLHQQSTAPVRYKVSINQYSWSVRG